MIKNHFLDSQEKNWYLKSDINYVDDRGQTAPEHYNEILGKEMRVCKYYWTLIPVLMSMNEKPKHLLTYCANQGFTIIIWAGLY